MTESQSSSFCISIFYLVFQKIDLSTQLGDSSHIQKALLPISLWFTKKVHPILLVGLTTKRLTLESWKWWTPHCRIDHKTINTWKLKMINSPFLGPKALLILISCILLDAKRKLNLQWVEESYQVHVEQTATQWLKKHHLHKSLKF